MKKLCLGWKSCTIREQNLTLFSWPKRRICLRTLSIVDVKPFFPPPFSSLSPLKQKTWWTFPFAFSFHPEGWVLRNDNSFSIVKLLHLRISPCTSVELSRGAYSRWTNATCYPFIFPLQGMRKRELQFSKSFFVQNFSEGLLVHLESESCSCIGESSY